MFFEKQAAVQFHPDAGENCAAVFFVGRQYARAIGAVLGLHLEYVGNGILSVFPSQQRMPSLYERSESDS